LKEDHEAFVAAGGDLQKAKEYNNVIAPYFFEIPLDQVLVLFTVTTHSTNYPN